MLPKDCPSLDLRGHDSPVLALLVRRALAALAEGQTLEVWLSSPQWACDLPCILARCGERCLSLEHLPQGYRLLLRRGGTEPPARPCLSRRPAYPAS